MLDQHKREERWRQRQWLKEQQARVRHSSLGKHRSHHHHNFCPPNEAQVAQWKREYQESIMKDSGMPKEEKQSPR